MEMNKTLASSGGRITVIDALRGFSLIGVWQVLHYIFLPVWFELLYPDGPGSSKRC